MVAGQNSLAQIAKSASLAVLRAAQEILGAAVAAGAAQSLLPSVLKALNLPVVKSDPQLIAFTVGPMLASAATNLAKSLLNALLEGRLSEAAALVKTFDKFKKRVADNIEDLPPDFAKSINRMNAILEQLANPVRHGNESNFDSTRFERLIRHTVQLLGTIHATPMQVKGWNDQDSRESMLTQLDEAFKFYESDVADALKSAAVSIASRSHEPPPEPNAPRKPRLQYLLTGPGGTGKDYSIDAIARVLNLPILEFSIPNAKDGGVDALFGNPSNAIDIRLVTYTDQQIVGEVPLRIIESKSSNPIIKISEADLGNPIIADGVKRVLDPSRTHIYCKCLDVHLPFTDPTIFITSNREPKGDDIEPIYTRANNIKMLSSSHGAVNDAIGKSIHTSIEGMKHKLSEEDILRLRNLAGQAKMQTADCHPKKFGGARISAGPSAIAGIVTDMISGLTDAEIKRRSEKRVKAYYNQFPWNRSDQDKDLEAFIQTAKRSSNFHPLTPHFFAAASSQITGEPMSAAAQLLSEMLTVKAFRSAQAASAGRGTNSSTTANK